MLSLPELALILFVVLVVFGANRVPELGDIVGGWVGKLFGKR